MYSLIGKLLSLLVALGYAVGLVIASEEINAGLVCPCIYLLFPLGLIWFPEEAGSLTGYVGHGGNMDTETPPILVSIFGWIFLVGPFVLSFFFGE